MKKLWIWLALVVTGIAAALFFGRSRVQQSVPNQPWPLALGPVSDAPKHFPSTKQNEPAARLVSLARNARVDLRAEDEPRMLDDLGREFREYLRVQLERSGEAIDAPPSDVARYLTDNAATLDEIRTLVLSEEIVFDSEISKAGREALGPPIAAQQDLHRAFVARALVAARDGKSEAWNELRAAWALARPLWRRPEPIGPVAGSTAARMINGAARKLPLPVPEWFREIGAFDYERALAAAQQADAWRRRTTAFDVRVRGMAEEVLRAKACDVTSPQFEALREKLAGRATPNLVGEWQRLMRFRAEREATQRVLQIRSGQKPSSQSQCSDGSWEVTATSFRFTRDVPVEGPQIKYPLEYSKTEAR